MIKKIVEDMGGDMTLKSRVAKGATVTLSLPSVLAGADPTGEPQGQ